MSFRFSQRYSSSCGRGNGAVVDSIYAHKQDKSARGGKQLARVKGVPNTATVRANDDEVCYKIDILSKSNSGLEMV